MQATIKISPSQNQTFNPPVGTVQQWFEANWTNPNVDIEKSVAFDKDDLQSLLDNGCVEIILSKQNLNGRNTLAIAGIDNSDDLQNTDGSLMLLGNHFNLPTSNDQFTIDLNNLIQLSPDETWGAHYNLTGSFNSLMADYNIKPYRCNHFSTVIFTATSIDNLIATPNCSKIAFMSGYVWVNSEIQNPVSEGGLTEIINKPVETLLAFAVNSSDQVVGGPTTPSVFWPPKYKTYS